MTNIREQLSTAISKKIPIEKEKLFEREKELKSTIVEKLLNNVGVLSIKKDLERAKKLMNVSSKTICFFNKPNTDKVYALMAEELIVGEEKVLILKSFTKGDSKIITKEELLSNPNLIAVSTAKTTLNELKIRANAENKIQELFELPELKNTNQKDISAKNKLKPNN